MTEETLNPFQATFPPNETAALPMPELPETTVLATGKPGRPPKVGKTRSAPITRPRKTASKKANKPASAAPKKKRGRPPKAKSVTPPPHALAAAEIAKRGRKPASPPAAGKGVMIELGAALNAMAGLQQEDAVLLSQIVTALLQKPKDTRTRIIAAIGKVLA